MSSLPLLWTGHAHAAPDHDLLAFSRVGTRGTLLVATSSEACSPAPWPACNCTSRMTGAYHTRPLAGCTRR